MTSTFWDKRARKYDKDVSRRDADFNKTITAIKAVLSGDDRVLDVGCATGEHSVALSPFVAHIHGIDYSPKMIQLARAKSTSADRQNTQFFAIDVFHPSLEDESYTLVLALSVLHLVDDVVATLRKLYSLISPGGALIVQAPCLGERPMLAKTLISFAQIIGIAPKIHSFKYPALEEKVSDAGFSVATASIWDREKAMYWIIARKADVGMKNRI